MAEIHPTVRHLRADDRAALAAFPGRVSSASAVARFHGAVTTLTGKTLDRLLDLEPGQREAFIALDQRGIVGVARYARDDVRPADAEVAIIIADEWQHRGIARELVRPLMLAAQEAGIERFRGSIQPDNMVARRFFLGLASTATEHRVGGEVVVTIDLADALRPQP